jgi:hypothetical protein
VAIRETLSRRAAGIPVWGWIAGAVVVLLAFGEMRTRGRFARSTQTDTRPTVGGEVESFPTMGAVAGPPVAVVANPATPDQIMGGLGRQPVTNALGASGRAGQPNPGNTSRLALVNRHSASPALKPRGPNLVTAGRSSPLMLAHGTGDQTVMTYAR